MSEKGKLKYGQAKIQFIACRDKVIELQNAGYSVQAMYRQLFGEGRITMSYNAFHANVRKFTAHVTKNRPKSTGGMPQAPQMPQQTWMSPQTWTPPQASPTPQTWSPPQAPPMPPVGPQTAAPAANEGDGPEGETMLEKGIRLRKEAEERMKNYKNSSNTPPDIQAEKERMLKGE
jgi:hypothetical protein